MADEIAACLFDNAITACGIAIENALLERVNYGSKEQPDWQDKYALSQLLDTAFRLPRPLPVAKPVSGIKAMMGMGGASGGGVKMWKAIPPV